MFASRPFALVLAVALLLSACGAGDSATDLDPALARLGLALDVVEVLDADAEDVAVAASYLPGVVGSDLTQGDGVRTGTPGFAQIDHRDGSLTRLDVLTEFIVTALDPQAEDARVATRLDTGRAWSRVHDLGETGTFQVETPVGTAAVRGTAFDVDCRQVADAGCVFTIVEGVVAVDGSAGPTADLVPVQRVAAAPDGTLGEILELTLADLLGDPWFAFNLAEDAKHGFPTLAPAAPGEPDGDPAPPVSTEPPGLDGPADLQSSQVETGEDGTVTQRVVVGGPRRIALTWSFCNPQTCGTSENQICTSGYNPRYAGQLLQTIVVPPPSGFVFDRASIAVGATTADAVPVGGVDASGFAGSSAGFVEPPTATPTGGVRLVLRQGGLEGTLRYLPDFPGRACAIGQERRDEILAQYGANLELDAAVVELDIVWKAETPFEAPVEQILEVGGREVTVTFQPPPARLPLVADAPIHLVAPEGDTEGDTAGDGAGNAAGVVATSLANAMARLGRPVTPQAVASKLTELAAGDGLAPLRVGDALSLGLLVEDAELAAQPSGLVDALRALSRGDSLGLATLVRRGERTLVVLLEWDAAGDTVTLLHPEQGVVALSLSSLADVLAELHVATRVAEVEA